MTFTVAWRRQSRVARRRPVHRPDRRGCGLGGGQLRCRFLARLLRVLSWLREVISELRTAQHMPPVNDRVGPWHNHASVPVLVVRQDIGMAPDHLLQPVIDYGYLLAVGRAADGIK